MTIRTVLALALIGPLVACGSVSPKAGSYTLYRTSSIAPGARVHWATFAAKESNPTYNADNCAMTARLLTANMKELNGEGYNPRLGFWCEPGSYEPSGDTPTSFAAEFPTDTE